MVKLYRASRLYCTIFWWALLVLYIVPVSSSNDIRNGQIQSSQHLGILFPAWRESLQVTANKDCSAEVEKDQKEHRRQSYATVECLLKTFPEFRKAEMAASSVLLGLLPVVLSQLGPSTIEQSLLHLRQPVLAALVAFGSPAVIGLQNTQYIDALCRQLRTDGSSSIAAELPFIRIVWIKLSIQVILAVVAVGNVGMLAYELSDWAVTAFAIGFFGLPGIWMGLALAIHALRLVALSLKVKIQTANVLNWQQYLWTVECESKITLHERPSAERKAQIGDILAWLLYIFTSVHTLFGVLSLSGLLFISMQDAVRISGRFLLSAIGCKLVFTLEAAGIKETIVWNDKADDNAGNKVKNDGDKTEVPSTTVA